MARERAYLLVVGLVLATVGGFAPARLPRALAVWLFAGEPASAPDANHAPMTGS